MNPGWVYRGGTRPRAEAGVRVGEDLLGVSWWGEMGVDGVRIRVWGGGCLWWAFDNVEIWWKVDPRAGFFVFIFLLFWFGLCLHGPTLVCIRISVFFSCLRFWYDYNCTPWRVMFSLLYHDDINVHSSPFLFYYYFFSVTRLILCSSIVNFCHIFQGISSGSSCTRNAVIILLLLLSVLHSIYSSPGTASPFLSYVPSSHAEHSIPTLVHLYLHI